MNGLRKKFEKPPFLAFWAKMANFGPFLAKMGQTRIFFKQARGARSLGKFPKYRNKIKSEK